MDIGKIQGKKCFIITPIGNPDSEIYRKISGVIDSVIRPVLQRNGFIDVRASHEISEPGSINTQIINRIVEDDLVVANLTENNPNVMYELCLRHVTAKPIIHICETGTILPFDIKDNRTIFYKNDMYGVFELTEKIEVCLKQIDFNKEYRDNPIFSALTFKNLLKPMEEDNKNTLLLQQILENLKSKKNLDNISAKYRIELRTKEATYKLKRHIMLTGIQDAAEIDLDMKNCQIDLRLSDDEEINNIISFLDREKLEYKIIKYR